MTPEGVLLYLDEIQYFNKSGQSLLEFIENGKITLSLYYGKPVFLCFQRYPQPLQIFEFKQITAREAIPAIRRAINYMEKEAEARIEPEVIGQHCLWLRR